MKENTVVSVALVGFALWETANAYGQFAPSLSDMREAKGFDVCSRQQLLDCDVMVGGIAFMAGGLASWLSRSWLPLLVTIAGFLWISGYHHLVLRGPTTDEL